MSKNVVITGVAGGIGQSLVDLFKEKNWNVLGIDREPAVNVDDFYQGDLREESWVKKVGETIGYKYTSINGFVHSAVKQVEDSVVDMTLEDWRSMIDVNVTSSWLLARQIHPCLSDGGAIVNISSVHARATSMGLAGYASSKGALNSLTRSMALEWAEDNIRVNAILPGATDTDLLEQGFSRSDNPGEARQSLVEKTPLGRIANPGEIARLCYFLIDNEGAKNITGQTIVSDGGVLAQLASETELDSA